MDFVPNPGIGYKVVHADAENRIVLDAIKRAQHQIFSVFIGPVGRLLGRTATRERGKTVIELAADCCRQNHADYRRAGNQPDALASNAKMPERDGTANDQVNKTGAGSRE